jgi:hypothetical protein
MKRLLGELLTTVFPRQGHYALNPRIIASNPAADITIERVGDLVEYDLPTLLRARKQGQEK